MSARGDARASGTTPTEREGQEAVGASRHDQRETGEKRGRRCAARRGNEVQTRRVSVRAAPKGALPRARARKPSAPIIKTRAPSGGKGTREVQECGCRPGRSESGSEREGQEASHATHHHHGRENKRKSGVRRGAASVRRPATARRKDKGQEALQPIVTTEWERAPVGRAASRGRYRFSRAHVRPCRSIRQ